jgi:PAS domain S-box-containing protein
MSKQSTKRSTPPQPSGITTAGGVSASSSQLPSQIPNPSAPPLSHLLLPLLDHISDSILCLDRDFRITFANAEARRVSRITSADLNNRTHWDMYPETVGTALDRTYREVMATGQPAQIEYFYPPFHVWIDVHVFPTEEGIALYYRDITDRKTAEAARDTANSKFSQVLEAAPDSIVCIDRNWNCSFANRAAHIILKTDHLIGTNLWTAFPLNQTEPFASNYRATMERSIPTEFEAHYPEPLNIWFKVSSRPFEDGIIIFSSDITARKKAEARRDTTNRQLQQVFEATADFIVSLARDWTFTFLNSRGQERLSIKGDLIGKNLWEEFPAAVGSDFHTNYSRTMNEGVTTEFEAYYAEPLNIWLNITCRPSDDGIVLFCRDITAERAAKQALLDQQATLAFVQQTARVATWQIDLATSTVTFGPGSASVFGRDNAEIATIHQWEQIIHPDDLLRVREATQRALVSREVTIVDYRVLSSEGIFLWVEGRRTPTYDSAGTATHIRGVTHDITARKQKEEELAASEERYRVLADLNPQAIWMGSPEGHFTYANQGFLDYIGFTMEAASDGLNWLNAFYEEDRQNVLAAWSHSVNTGEEYALEARMVRARDGAICWWYLRALPIRDEAGKVINWLGVANDIHDRKTHADQLYAKQLETERQRAELETIYATAPVGLALFDPIDFRYQRLNDRQAAFFGLKPNQILGKTLTEMATIPGLRELFEQVAKGTPIVSQILEGKVASDHEGTHRHWTVNCFPVYNADGSVRAISAATLEITNQRKAEIALIQSEKLAAVGRLASSISHEINNPLEAITNILYLIDHDQTLSPELKPLVNMAQSELARVCQIATQTLRFHRQSVRAASVTGENLVGAVLNLYQGRLNNSGISIQAVYATSAPILCLENDIRQVLNNLIANAIDAMRQKGGRLVVRAHSTTINTQQHPHGTPAVRITIADTGHGMSPAVQARIFEPFYTTKDLNGTGLGLWISAGIVARHNGHLLLRSSTHPTHHGTVFSLLLPTEEEPTHLTT